MKSTSVKMNKVNRAEQLDPYEIEEPSDEERAASSSEDELDILLNGTPDQKRKLIREYLTGESESSSGDDFEKEMEAELSSTLKTMEGTWGPAAGESSTAAAGLPEANMYDKIYFDSDSDDDDTPSSSTGRRRRQRRIPTNEELFYDPDEDDRDQAWVDAKRRKYSRRAPGSLRLRSGAVQGLPSSDAILNCPACMTTLCLDCQRHEKYRTQYRAMFVMNCTVKKDEVLRYDVQKEQGKKRKRRANRRTKEEEETAPGGGPRGMDQEEVYHPVQCSECSTEVAVLDKEEVFHFFNILASHC